MADAWLYPYTDFGESHGVLGRPVLRAAVPVRVPGRRRRFSALIDTGGPVTVVAHEVVAAGGGEPLATGETLPIRLGGRQFVAPLFELTLEVLPPDHLDRPALSWRGTVGVVSPFPHQGSSVILGQIGFLERFTVTFGPGRFAVEPGHAFDERFGGA